MKNRTTGFLDQTMLADALRYAETAQYTIAPMRLSRIRTATRTDRSRPELIIRKPEFWEFSFETQVFGQYAWVRETLEDAIVESYLQGSQSRKSKILAASRRGESRRSSVIWGIE